jgi:hypothetical protein
VKNAENPIPIYTKEASVHRQLCRAKAFKHGSADYTDFHGLISRVKKDISN